MTSTANDPSRRDRLGILIAWVAIAISTGLIVAAVFRADSRRNQFIREAEAGLHDGVENPQFDLQAKYAVGTKRLAQMGGSPTPAGLSAELRKHSTSRDDRLKLVPVLGELDGKAAAIAELDRLFGGSAAPSSLPTQAPSAAATEPATSPASQPFTRPPTVRVLYEIYTNGAESVSPDDRRFLADRLGWSGRLALTFNTPDDRPERQAITNEAVVFASIFLGVVLAGLGGIFIGLVLLVLTITWLVKGSLRLRYPETEPSVAVMANLAPGELPSPWMTYGGAASQTGATPLGSPPSFLSYSMVPAGLPPGLGNSRTHNRWGPLRAANGRTGPFLEAFAIYLAGQVAISRVLHALVDDYSIAWNFAAIVPVIIALFWPRIRGIRGHDFRRGFGWTAPRGILREIGSGLVGYITGMPVFALGFIVTIVLIKVFNATPTHPIAGEAGGIWQNVMLIVLASVWAPVVEETFFRGALFHHLRTRLGWILSALFSSLIFAAIHPQGWTLVPALMSLAIVFCAIREWRGSTFGGMIAHAMHNGTLVALMILAAG